MKNTQQMIPPLVVCRAKSAGAAGEAWLANLDTDGTGAAPESDYMNELANFLLCEYNFKAQDISSAKRGFYGETWNVQTEKDTYFVKIDYWNYHKESYQISLSAVQYMTDNGISFIPKIIKTKNGRLCSHFKNGVVAVFEYIPGELLENCSVTQLYGHLSRIYQLKAKGIELERENFGTELIDTFQNLRNIPELPAEVIKALDSKETAISRYTQRLQEFSAVCKDDKEHFCITHGDAGGNCILNNDRLFIVDWDSVMLAPIERDAWIFLCDRQQLDKINFILSENGIDYTLMQKRLCYYCYSFFFYYLDEYLKAILSTKNKGQKAAIAESLIEYLTDSWIYKRLDVADRINLPFSKDIPS